MCYSNSSMTTRKEIEKSSVDDKSQFDVIYTEVINYHFLVYNLNNIDEIILEMESPNTLNSMTF